MNGGVRRGWLLPALAALLPLALFLTPVRNLDLWWHLDSGRWMLEQGRYLDQEVRSFTLPGAHWNNFSWLFQVAVALVEYLAGDWGLLLLKGGLWWGILTLLLRAAGRRGMPLAGWLALALLSWQLFPAMHLRPHLFEGLFLAATVWLLRQPPDRRWLASATLLVLLWANSHASVVVGASALALHWLLPHWYWPGRVAVARRLPGALLLGMLVFFTPLGLELLAVLRGHALADYTTLYLREWLPTEAMPPFLFLGLVALVLLLPLWRRLLTPAELLLAAVFLVLAGSNKRFLFELALVLIRPLTALIGRALSGLGTRRPALFGRNGWRAGVLLLGALIALFPPPWAWQRLRAADYPVMQRHYPHLAWAVLRPVVETEGPLRVWNAYGWGGWLGWISHGGLRIAIDGRTPTLFDEELMMQGHLARHRPAMLHTLLAQWQVDAVVLRRQSPLPIGPRDPDWWLVAYDNVSATWLRADIAARHGLHDLGFDPFRPLLRLPPEARNEAITLLRRLLAAEAGNTLAWTHLAELLMQGGAEDADHEIETALAHAIEQDPEAARPRLRLAQWRRRQYRPADDWLTPLLPWALRARGRDLTGFETALARLLLAGGRAAEALELLRSDDWQRMQTLNRDPEVWMLRARAHRRLGDMARATRATRLAGWLVLDAGPTAQARYRRLLDTIEGDRP